MRIESREIHIERLATFSYRLPASERSEMAPSSTLVQFFALEQSKNILLILGARLVG